MSSRVFVGLAGALALFAITPAVAKEPAKAPDGMVWIPGGEFSMGAATNGHDTNEMAMPSNDAEPIHRVRVEETELTEDWVSASSGRSCRGAYSKRLC